MEIISSLKNEKIKSLKKMVASGELVVLETRKSIEQALQFALQPQFVIASSEELFSITQSWSEQFQKSTEKILVSSHICESFQEVENSCNLIVFAKKLTQNNSKISQSEKILVLENIQDAGNVGTMIRSAFAFGFEKIVMIGGAKPFSGKVVRSSTLTVFALPILEFCSTQEFLDCAKENSLRLICATMEGENVSNFKAPQSGFALVIGNEGKGVSLQMKNACESKVAIKMENNLESLNAAIAASILMFMLK